jgi:hypothetical protein
LYPLRVRTFLPKLIILPGFVFGFEQMQLAQNPVFFMLCKPIN